MTWSCSLLIDGQLFAQDDLLGVDMSRMCDLTGEQWHVLGDPMASPDHLIGYLACFSSRVHGTTFEAELARYIAMPWRELLDFALFPAAAPEEPTAAAVPVAPARKSAKKVKR